MMGVLMVPIVPFESLRGIDRHRKKLIFQMIREIQEERAREASDDDEK
jgi:hypothetical protein